MLKTCHDRLWENEPFGRIEAGGTHRRRFAAASTWRRRAASNCGKRFVAEIEIWDGWGERMKNSAAN